MKTLFMPFFFATLLACTSLHAQTDTVFDGRKVITLNTVTIDKNFNVPAFINRIKEDSSYYKAFRNLHVIGFTAINDIRMLDKKGGLDASLFSRTKQVRKNNCRTMQVLEEKSTGDFYDKNGGYNYYTAQMYASLFFTKGAVCHETNIVAGTSFSTEGKKGLEKHKEQLKMLFFNPGRRISGLPFMSNKTAIYDDDMADRYDMNIDMELYNNNLCYVFKQNVKPGKADGVIVDEMITWFDEKTYDVVARKYSLSYDAAVYDFKVDMEVQMTRFGNLTVPSLIRYHGNWKAVTKKRERGVFTATLSAFE
jgi:hypothetical protein